MEFSYTVQAGDFDLDGVTLCASGPGCGSIQLNGGSIRGAADGLDIKLALPRLGAQAGQRVDALAVSTTCAAEIEVPTDWALIPSGSGAGPGDRFRLIFLSSTSRNATSSNIADYNRFVQDRAAGGHADIRRYSAGFRAVASTESVDARDNTCSTGTGVRIHWLNGSKVADNYGDFYDGGWDDEANPRRANGATQGPRNVWTGSSNNGTEAFDGSNSLALGAGGNLGAALGKLNHGTSGPLSSGITAEPKSRNKPLYGLSQVFRVRGAVTAPSVGNCTAEVPVPSDWALKPSSVSAGAKFRLLFVSSTKRDATSGNIADYNSFVQGRAAAGNTAIQTHSRGFRVLGSTQAVNARVNTCTQSTDTDAAVYWLNGAKVADNYAGLYDGGWDSNADRLESGSQNTATGNDAWVWTGTNSDGGTDGSGYLGHDGSGQFGRDARDRHR